jgi:hypothetical protein
MKKDLIKKMLLEFEEDELPETFERELRLPEELFNRVNSNCKEFQRWVSRMIHYAPQHWGNIHAFNEFLQSTSEGKKLLEEKIG